MNKKNIKKICIYLCFLICIFRPALVYATNAEITFGSINYEADLLNEFPMGIYINADEAINTYSVIVKYDKNRLQYISGADTVDEENGLLTFTGETSESNIKLWLVFKAISGGNAYTEIVDASGTDVYGNSINITNFQKVMVTISGQDTAIVLEQNNQEELNKPEIPSEEISSEEISMENQTYKKNSNKEGINMIILWIIIVGCIIVFSLILLIILRYYNKLNKNKKKSQVLEEEFIIDLDDCLNDLDLYTDKIDADEEKIKEKLSIDESTSIIYSDTEKQREIVIKIENVSMAFTSSTSNASGMKEYFIQKIKHQIIQKKFWALRNINFDIYKGEIVGIIGTNGSGKSTLLKVISGALRPTQGNIVVDKNKIQLLTLGTGFDLELSARENVYLNGAIIGYSKEFIDKHFEEIIEFAELQEFVDEKVKNFSSGMVSRLGFSIATVGAAAEILILDEVLSVGDEFFRKKSLKRVKELIHSGSTVLMVSHGMGTIMQNCTKVVWVEKGILQMIGEPSIVCKAYSNQFKKQE